MENLEQLEENNQPTKRPTFLTVICILTFISSSVGMLVSLLIPIIAEPLEEIIRSSPNFDEVKMVDAITVLQAGGLFYTINFILLAFSLAGAILMFRLRKIGFHFYTSANIGSLFLPMIYLHQPFNLYGLLITIGFVMMYAIHLKIMK
jgi:hypothetical protein